jgi:hypothetical protein
MSKAMIRAQRSARRVPQGAKILEFVESARIRKMLVAAALQGEPPVAAISREFASLVGPKDAKLAQVKQYVGLCVGAVLEEEGFEVERSGVWLGDDPVFSTGSVYRKIPGDGSSKRGDLLERFVKALSEEEALRVQALLGRRLGR